MKLLIREKSLGLNDLAVTVGLSSPMLTAGPVNKHGLFRELYNPMGFSAGSNVFTEKTDLRLSSSFYNDSNYFLFLEPVPDTFGMFCDLDNGKPVFWGGTISIDFCRESFISFIYSGSRPARDAAGEAWFTPRNNFSGGDIVHIGTKLCIAPPRFSFTVTEIISAGRLIPPGSFTRCTLSCDVTAFSPEVFIGVCTDGFITPRGDYEAARLKTGGKITITPAKSFSLHGGYELAYNHPEDTRQHYLEGEETWKAGAVWDMPGNSKPDCSFSSFLMVRLMYDKHGQTSCEKSASVTAELIPDPVSFRAALNMAEEGGNVTAAITSDISLEAGAHMIFTGGGLFLRENPAWSFRCSYRFTYADFCGYVTLSTRKPLPLESGAMAAAVEGIDINNITSILTTTLGCEISY